MATMFGSLSGGLPLDRQSLRRFLSVGGDGDLAGLDGRRSKGEEYDDEEVVVTKLDILPPAVQEQLPDGDADAVLTVGKDRVINYTTFGRLNVKARDELVQAVNETADMDNLRLMEKVRRRFQTVGLHFPRVEVRFKNLKVERDVYVGERGVPTLTNAALALVEGLTAKVGIKGAPKRAIVQLNSVSGVFLPGRMTLLLGPPGAGKTTLLRTLAGQVKEQGVRITGDVLFNNQAPGTFAIERVAAYVDQLDRHLAVQTVHETLAFSARCMGVSSKEGDPRYRRLLAKEAETGVATDESLAQLMHKIFVRSKGDNIMVEVIARLLGLDTCIDTVIGNDMVKGISGGQKRRVTSGEMLVNTFKVMLLDEISTGLDSASTQLITAALSNIAHFLDSTVVIALLQPSPETYDLFDDIMLMSDHSVVYHGPRATILAFFQTLHLVCPARKAHADFLQEVTSPKDQGFYWSNDKAPYHPIATATIVQRFYASPAGEAALALVDAPWQVAQEDIDDEVLPDVLKKYGLTRFQCLRACLSREWLLTRRNKLFVCIKVFQILFMAFIIATLFKKLPRNTLNDGNLMFSVMFQSVLFMYLNGFSEIPGLVDALPVFYKQRNYRFYPAWAYAIASALCRMPQNIVESTGWTVIVYWSVGLNPSPGQFFIFLLVVILTNLLSTSLFRMLATIARHPTIANAMGAVVLLLTINTCGFTLSKPAIPSWWIWVYWANPVTYSMRALFINEFTSPQWATPTVNAAGNPTTLGLETLAFRGYQSQFWWVWIGVGYGILGVLACIGGQAFFLTKLDELRQDASVSEALLDLVDPSLTLTLARAKEAADVELSQQASLDKTLSGRVAEKDVPDVDLDLTQQPKAAAAPTAAAAGTANSGDGAAAAAAAAAGDAAGAQAQPKVVVELEDGLTTAAAARNANAAAFDPLILSFKDIKYAVPKPGGAKGEELMLLKGISGCFRPGVLTALMGASGAGKTTLMDVLADRKTGGKIQGEVLVNGHPKEAKTFARVMGYVEQFDIHTPQATVREALTFSARMRTLPGRTKAEMEQLVTSVMDLVELHPIAHSMVGDSGSSGLSTEQRKRLTIAVELVSNPAIVFMDEPTSGLDARAAAIVMRTVRNTVNTGRTVVCTIHQPSLDIFQAFDELLLLKRGGQTVFFGPMGADQAILISHFESVEGAARFRLGYNPANWMLEVSSPGNEVKLGVDFAQIYEDSLLCKSNRVLVDSLSVPLEGSAPLHFDQAYAQTWWVQFRLLLGKNFTSYWRNPYYNLVRYIITIIVAIVFGSLYYKQGQQRDSINGVLNVMGALYSTYIFMGTTNCFIVLPVIGGDRVVFYRERASGMYKASAYSAAQYAVELPYQIVQAVLFTGIVYFMIGFFATTVKFFWFLLFFWLCLMVFTSFGIMCINLMPVVVLGTVLANFFLSSWNVFCGFLIQKPVFPPGWVWMYYLTPTTWLLYGGIVTQLGNDYTDTLTNTNGEVQTTSAFIEEFYGYNYNMRGYCVLILIGFFIIFRAVSTIALVNFNFSRR